MIDLALIHLWGSLRDCFISDSVIEKDIEDSLLCGDVVVVMKLLAT